ncbi:MAG: glycerol-3-phosphate 1-O-acyltransferase PlsY [Bacillota bacterium]
MPTVAAVLIGYLIGSVPFGYLAGKLHGRDIRDHGSGNIGTTNAFRLLGPAWAVAVLLLDAGKGLAACFVAAQLAGGASTIAIAAGGLAAVAGHNWSVFLRFRGGKGAATTAGIFLYMAPAVAAAGLGVAALTLMLTRYMSLGSMLGVVAGAVLMQFGGHPGPYRVAALVALVWLVWQHRENIGRLRRGQERKMGMSRREE